ncbi:hypothetical protein Q3V37_30335 [Micromonospora profundi]|uniref:Uncharacterized protein n=1 Tax=Micromonospora profundi TaxID=1420889 RepID=A0AAJ6HSM7_9ACTN|nr:hypothetical protein [Micromonospora profundi]WLS45592.1 hypothetical protein Q3V37_30335 [Micromonospora profundi]
MRVLFDGKAPVAYGQIYVTSRELPDMSEAFAGQVNGLCGAGQPGALFLMTGTHSGRVRFTVELHDVEPPAAAQEWEDVVEASFLPKAAVADLVPWGEGSLARLPLTVEGQDATWQPVYRVRYCAMGMDQGRDPFGGLDPDERDEDGHTYLDRRPDRYLLCLWPEGTTGGGRGDGVTRADAILRQTSGAAAYWHAWACSLPSPPTLWEQVEAEKHKRLERERRDQEYRMRHELRRWGGRPPSERLRQVHGNIFGIVLLDRDLVDGVAGVAAVTQRRIAIWAARQAFTVAGIADLDWLRPAWTALDRGMPLPAEFADPTALRTRIQGTSSVRLVLQSARPAGRSTADPFLTALDAPVDPVAMALPALAAAGESDPLQAALEALWAAVSTYAFRRAEFLADVRRVFPAVASSGLRR